MSAKLEEDLRNAADMGRLEQVKELVEKRGVDFRSKDKECERDAMHYAAGGNHFEVIKYLFSKGASINEIDKFKQTPLHQAAIPIGFPKNIEILRFLLHNGADDTIKDSRGKTALDYSKGSDLMREAVANWEEMKKK